MNNDLQMDEHHASIDGGQILDEPTGKPRGGAPFGPQRTGSRPSGADAFARLLVDLGVRRAFGLIGGAIAQVCGAMRRAGIEVFHARHETGAVFMAAEAHFITDEPVVVFATTGPGATNAITGMVSAALDGAKLIVVTGGTDVHHRGRHAFQETGAGSFDISNWVGEGSRYLHFSVEKEHEIQELGQRLATGLGQPGGFLATVTIPTAVQSARVAARPEIAAPPRSAPSASAEELEQVVSRLREGRFVIWVGHGAREAGAAIRELAERSGAPVIASPRAKGVFPESHPQYLGVTSMFGGHPWVQSYFRAQPPDHVLVLGTRLGQSTSCFDPTFAPRRGFIHVDVDPAVFGLSYPEVETLGVISEVSAFVDALVERWPAAKARPRLRPLESPPEIHEDGPVHPRTLMGAIQRVVVERSDALVMADVGNAFAWANAELRFETPGRYRTATGFAAMTKTTSGVVGAALASAKIAVAIVGDGAMLMGNEISTAVKHGVDAKWIVLNDACYGMVRHGMIAIGMEPFETTMPQTNFELFAVALGATGLRVSQPAELNAALEQMLATPGPVVLDVDMDPRVAPPFRHRNEVLGQGWE